MQQCNGLFYTQNSSKGVCSSGRRIHDSEGSGRYVVHLNASPIAGQPGWRWCARYRECSSSEVVASASARREEPTAPTEAADYILIGSDRGKGQNLWRWCSLCQGLFFNGNGLGLCPSGGEHSGKDSGDYTLMTEEDAGFLSSISSISSQDPLKHVRGEPQGQSWVNVNSPFGIIGQVFFPTDVHQLDDTDMAVLERIVLAYPPLFNVRRVNFEFHGHADHRHTIDHNFKLSAGRRAERVRDFLIEQLFPSPPPHSNFATTVRVYVEHPESQFLPADSEVLAGFRRTDIFAPPVKRSPQPPVNVPPPNRGSTRWQARISENRLRWTHGRVPDGHSRPEQQSRNEVSLRWDRVGGRLAGCGRRIGVEIFETSLAIRLTNFAGFARHTSAQAQLIAGPSIDIVHLLGPWHSAGAGTVYLEYVEMNEQGFNFGINAGTSVGTLDSLGPATPF